MKKFVLSVSLMLLLAGCGTNEAGQEAGPEEKENNNGQSETNEISKTGTFVGLADTHTIAVEIDGKETSFQVAPELHEKINGIEEGSSVEVKYVEGSGGVLDLKEIETK